MICRRTKVEDEVATSSTNMPQILAFIIFIGLGASYLFGQAQPEIASLFTAAISQTTQTSKSPAPSVKVVQKQIAKKPAVQNKQIIQQVPKKPAVSVSAIKPKSDISPYSGKVKISGFRAQTLSSPSFITLAINLQQDEKIDITGWEMKTKKGSFLIPKGLEQNIIVKQGDIIYISSDPSPFLEKDKNFRPNKCLGYLSNSRIFTISLPQTCPRPQTDQLPSYLSYWCKEYINTLGNCQAPTSEGMAKYELFKDDNCLSYLNSNLNYNGCFLNYQKDQDFSSNQWHVYLDRRDREIFPWTNEFDTLYLRDKNGLLVDKYDFGQRVCCD